MSFIHHAEACGLLIQDLIPDGRWHRVHTVDKPKKQNGAYVFDGVKGAVRNWATMESAVPYRPDRPAPRIDRAKMERDLAERRRRDHRIEEARHAKATIEAQKMLAAASFQQHNYLADKGFPDDRGLVLAGQLLIPMRGAQNYTMLSGLQTIDAGGKKFLPGTRAKGAVFKIGADAAPSRWLCEGFATALSLKAAMTELRRTAQVVVCFSAANLKFVSQMIKPPVFIMADNDESETGKLAAEATGLPWTMPTEVGMDANDLHQAYGLRALVKLMLDIRE
jgi:putative DNA primase/helicase